MQIKVNPFCVAAHEEGVGQLTLDGKGIVQFRAGNVRHDFPLSIRCLVHAAIGIVTVDDSISEQQLHQAYKMPNEHGLIAFQVSRHEAIEAPAGSALRQAVLDAAIAEALVWGGNGGLDAILDDLEARAGITATGVAIGQEDVAAAAVALRRSFGLLLDASIAEARVDAENARHYDATRNPS